MRNVQTPAARSTDPVTSHLAVDHINRSGLRGHQQRQVAAIVKGYPGRTSAELANLTGLDRHMIAKRLPECETAGAVCRGDTRPCTISRRTATTWLVGSLG